jgi:hypothetical protein
MKKANNVLVFGLLFLLALGLFAGGVSAYEIGRSNKSVQAAGLIDKAIICVGEMQSRGIRVTRVNESLNEALQLYAGQVALENQGRIADYKIILDDAEQVCSVSKNALKAQDELVVFNDTYTKAGLQINLSSMDNEYFNVLRSFQEERFEDTLPLIDKGYAKLSEVQASQTTLNLFYLATTRSIKSFFRENWKSLSIGVGSFVILLIIFWRVIYLFLLRAKLNNLYIRKISINELIKKMQLSYFKTKKMSEVEFSVKMKAFQDMIRDIDRQIPEVKEALAKADRSFIRHGKESVKSEVLSKSIRLKKLVRNVGKSKRGKFKYNLLFWLFRLIK